MAVGRKIRRHSRGVGEEGGSGKEKVEKKQGRGRLRVDRYARALVNAGGSEKVEQEPFGDASLPCWSDCAWRGGGSV